jgi:hypothetical protein
LDYVATNPNAILTYKKVTWSWLSIAMLCTSVNPQREAKRAATFSAQLTWMIHPTMGPCLHIQDTQGRHV